MAQDPSTQRYYLGSEAVQIGLAALQQCNPTTLGEPSLVRLQEEQRLCLRRSDPTGSLRAAVRTAGSASIMNTLLRGISAVAAAIFDHARKVCAVLTALGAGSVFDTSETGPDTVAVIRKAGDISAALGYRGRAAV